MPNDGIFNFLFKILNITVFLLVSFMDVSSLPWQQGKKKEISSCIHKGCDTALRRWRTFLQVLTPAEAGLQ